MRGAEIAVRPAVSSDAPAIVERNLALASESEGRALDRAVVEAGVRAILADPGRGRYWIAELDGRVVGQCLVTTEWSDWSGGAYWWLQSVYVDREARGTGVFRSLFDRVRSEAGNRDVAALRLYVDEENRSARAVYERLGMDRTGYRIYQLSLMRGPSRGSG